MDMRASASDIARESLPPELGKPEYPRFLAWFRVAPLQALRWLIWRDGDARHFRAPVRWLLGGDLLASMKEILLYGAFGEELDHRDWMRPEPIDLSARAADDEAFFIDYVADMGDGQLAMYDVAALVLSDLWLRPDGSVSMHEHEGSELPRGQVLFIGGDCAYHIANDTTLRERVIAPFRWAARERGLGRPLPDARPERIVVGVPANHDYYDSLVGFNRFLRAPGNPRTAIADYACVQQASYVALRLPHGFWWFGLDSQNGKLDYRQQLFFRDLMRSGVPKRLIVATPEPTTVLGRVHETATRPFRDLGLPRPFLDPACAALPSADSVHLDLSGDVHHYAYYEPKSGTNYASVMAGGAGAFLHPSHASHAGDSKDARWPEQPPAIYPSPEHSRFAVIGKLLSPLRIAGGGLLFAVGALCSLLVAHAVPQVQELGALSYDDRIATAFGLLLLGVWIATFEQSGRIFRRATAPLLHNERQSLLEASGVKAQWREPVSIASYARVLLPWLVVLAMGALLEPEAQAATILSDCVLVLCLSTLPVMGFWVAQYTSTLPKQAKVRTLRELDYLLPTVTALAIGAVVGAIGVRAFGNTRLSSLAWNAASLLAAAMLLVVPMVLGASQGVGRPRPVRAGYALLGALLGVLLLCTPLCVGLHGHGLPLVIALVTVSVMAMIAARVHVKHGSPWLLLALWLATALLALAPSVWLARVTGAESHLACAALVGGASTCIWLGWYLATALAFGAHVNEAGGAARSDSYRHFVRLKLSKSGVTGYVIGFDQPAVCTELSCPHEPGQCQRLKPRLVHSFTLAPLTPNEPPKQA